jgi:hypothetical protein
MSRFVRIARVFPENADGLTVGTRLENVDTNIYRLKTVPATYINKSSLIKTSKTTTQPSNVVKKKSTSTKTVSHKSSTTKKHSVKKPASKSAKSKAATTKKTVSSKKTTKKPVKKMK